MNAHSRGMKTTANNPEHDTRSTIAPGARTGRPISPLLLTIPEAAQVLAVGRTTMYQLIGTGEISLVRIGRSVRVSIATLEDFVAERENDARATVRTPSPSPHSQHTSRRR